eukprot:Opistho-2@28421
MAKGKKKKSKEKLTDEERQLLSEQLVLRREEDRKRKEELTRQYLKEKLAAEEKNSKINNLKIQNHWRDIMRLAKAQDLKRDIEILIQTFEREVDRKDAIIKSLARDLEEAEEQYQMALHSHMQNVDQVVGLQETRLGDLETEFIDELETIKAEFNREREMIISQHREERQNLADIMYAMEYEFNEAEAEARHEFQSVRDEVKNKNLEEKHALRIQLEGTVEDLWRQFQNALNNYNANTEERKHAFETLKEKDMRSAKTIEQQMKRLQRIQESVAYIKQRMAGNATECEERNRGLKDEKDAIATHFQELKSRMNSYRDSERGRLTRLTLASNKAMKALKQRLNDAERMLKLAEMNRKLETEQEKVLPFYAATVTDNEADAAAAASARPEGAAPPSSPPGTAAPAKGKEAARGNDDAPVSLPSLEPIEAPAEPATSLVYGDDGKPITEHRAMDQFWKRYNKVLLDRLALERDRDELGAENARLRGLLKQYLDGISVSEEVISHENPLFVVNGRTNVRLAQGYGAGTLGNRPTAVDAVHVYNTQYAPTRTRL